MNSNPARYAPAPKSQEEVDALLQARADRLSRPLQEDHRSGGAHALLVHVGQEIYAVEVKYLAGVLTSALPTRIPGAAPGVEGVVSFRGRVTPVLDLAILFASGTGSAAAAGIRPILLLRTSSRPVGLSVDAVGEMISVPETEAVGTSAADQPAFARFVRKASPGGPWIVQMQRLYTHPLLKSLLAGS